MPSIEKRSNAYRITVSLGYDKDGKQIRKTTTYKPPCNTSERKAFKLAQSFAFDFEAKCRGMVNLNENIRFSDLADWYFEQIAPLKLKEKSLQSNRYLLQKYVLPEMGHLRLRNISPMQLDALFAKLLNEGRTKELYTLKKNQLNSLRRQKLALKVISKSTLYAAQKGRPVTKHTAESVSRSIGKPVRELFLLSISGGGLSPGSVNRIRNILSPIFSNAVKKGILSQNPISSSTAPKPVEKQAFFLNAAGCRELLCVASKLPNPQLERAVRILLLTGMRVGELMALHWQDVHFDQAFIEVKYTLCRLDGEYRLSSPKTKSSARCIAISHEVMDILQQQKLYQERLRQISGETWHSVDSVFCNRSGGYMNAAYLNNSLRKLLREHQLPPVHVHDLRHANASLLINMGIPLKVVSEHLGHLDCRTTETIYAHVFNETKAQTAEAVSNALSSDVLPKASKKTRRIKSASR